MLYDSEKHLITGAIGVHIARIEHIGSTAVPGLGAKPIIDITASLHTLKNLETCITALKPRGYQHRGEAGIPGRQFFLKISPLTGKRTHHLHLIEEGNPYLEEHILYRDYLRLHQDVANEYFRLKQTLAAQYGNDRDGYTNAKSDFIQSVLNRIKEQ